MGVLPEAAPRSRLQLAVPRPEAKRSFLLRGANRPMRVGHSDHDDVVLLMLSAGVDALVVEEAFRRRRRNTGKIGIAVQVAREVARRRPLPRLRVRTEGRAIDGGWVIVGNARCCSGPLRASRANRSSPARSWCRPASVGRRRESALALAFGRHLNARRGAATQRAGDRRAAAGSVRLPWKSTDPIMALPVTLEVDPRPLLVRLPETT
jgi:hypothetical protein